MDTPQRWQVASIATAVAGLGLGSLLVGRSPSVEVAPIDLDTAMITAASDDPSFNLRLPDPAEIVIPEIREDRVPPAVEPTPASLASPDMTEPAPAAPAPPPAPQASPHSVVSPDSVDSASD